MGQISSLRRKKLLSITLSLYRLYHLEKYSLKNRGKQPLNMLSCLRYDLFQGKVWCVQGPETQPFGSYDAAWNPAIYSSWANILGRLVWERCGEVDLKMLQKCREISRFGIFEDHAKHRVCISVSSDLEGDLMTHPHLAQVP